MATRELRIPLVASAKETPGSGPSTANKAHHVIYSIRQVDGLAHIFELAFTFGRFRLLPAQRLLLEDEQPVRLGSRALEILLALVERPGELIGKRELMARVWPNLVVVEANLTVHIAALRRALGDGRTGKRYVINIPGRGYCFVAPVIVMDDQTSFSANHTWRTRRPNSLAQTTLTMDRFDISSVD